MICEILNSRTSRGAIVGICALVKYVEEQHSVDLTRFKTAMGRQQRNVELAVGEGHGYIVASMDALVHNLDMLCDIGAVSFDASRTETVLHPSVANAVLDSLEPFWRALLLKEIALVQRHSVMMLGLAFGQLHHCDVVRATGRMKMKALWTRLVQMEAASLNNNSTRAAINNLEWPRSQWSRELLLGLAEADWSSMPADLLREVRESSFVVGTPLPNELIHNFCRAQTEGVRNGRQSAQQVYHAARNSGVLRDFECGPTAIEAEDEVRAPKEMSPDLFVANNNCDEFSLGGDVADAYLEGIDAPYMSIERHQFVPFATQAFLDVNDESEPHDTWLSLLCVDGRAVWRDSVAERSEVFYVVGVTTHGVIGIPCSSHVLGGIPILKLDLEAAAEAAHHYIRRWVADDGGDSRNVVDDLRRMWQIFQQEPQHARDSFRAAPEREDHALGKVGGKRVLQFDGGESEATLECG